MATQEPAGAVQPLAAVPSAPSVLDMLRAERQRVQDAAENELVADVPGYKGRLAVRYIYPKAGYGPIAAAMTRAQMAKDKTQALLDVSCDTLIACADSVLGRNAAGQIVNLETDTPVAPGESTGLRFGKKLAGLLGIELTDELQHASRFVVRHVFSPHAATTGVFDGDLRLIGESSRVFAWLTEVESEQVDEFVGE